jgi:hypothetical protein
MAKADPGLEPVLAETVQLTLTFWVSVRQELLDHRRIRVVRDWLIATVGERLPSLDGPGGGARLQGP